MRGMILMTTSKRDIVYSSAVAASPVTRSVETSSMKSFDFKNWLPFCADSYKISPEISDYVLIPVTIFPSELPNRNGVGFSYTELTRFDPDVGTLAYKTWIGKPLFSEHKNDDITLSRGVILDSVITPISKSVWAVTLLSAWDRTKDVSIVNSIISSEESCFSMGCYTSDYSCSICDTLFSQGGCNHVSRSSPMRIIDGKLAYRLAHGITGFELSHVETPAFVDATTPKRLAVPM